VNTLEPADLAIALAIAITALTAYTTGRVHQWSRRAAERKSAYCQGYNDAVRPVSATAPWPAHRSKFR